MTKKYLKYILIFFFLSLALVSFQTQLIWGHSRIWKCSNSLCIQSTSQYTKSLKYHNGILLCLFYPLYKNCLEDSLCTPIFVNCNIVILLSGTSSGGGLGYLNKMSTKRKVYGRKIRFRNCVTGRSVKWSEKTGLRNGVFLVENKMHFQTLINFPDLGFVVSVFSAH